MRPEEKIKVAKRSITEIRILAERAKELGANIKSLEAEYTNGVMENNTTLVKIQMAMKKIDRLDAQRKEITAKKNNIRESLYAFIMGEGEYDETQLEFDDLSKEILKQLHKLPANDT